MSGSKSGSFSGSSSDGEETSSDPDHMEDDNDEDEDDQSNDSEDSDSEIEGQVKLKVKVRHICVDCVELLVFVFKYSRMLRSIKISLLTTYRSKIFTKMHEIIFVCWYKMFCTFYI